MATQNPLFPPGTWVQLSAVPSTWNRPLPTAQEQTMGMVRSAFTTSSGPMYQVVWMPGSMHPQTGLYTADQLTCITQQQAAQTAQQLNTKQYTIQSGNPLQPTGSQV